MASPRTERLGGGALAALLLFASCARERGQSSIGVGTDLEAVPAPDLAALETATAETLETARAEAGRALAIAFDDRARAAALAGLARAYHAHGLTGPARAAYSAALDHAPNDEDLFFLAGRLELDAAALDRAAALLGRAVELAPADAHALAALSSTQRRLGETRRALATAELATAAAPAFGLGWLARAEAAADAGEADLAADAYARFFAIHPEASKYRVPYGQVLRRSGRLEEAAAQLALRGEGVPTISDPRLAAVATLHVGARTDTIDGARLIQAGALAEGVAKLKRALATDPSDAEAHRNLAVGLLRLGRGAEAVASMEQAARLSPSDPEVRFSLGAVLAAAGRHLEAEAAYLAALEIDPGHLDSLQNLANLRLRANRPGAALEDLRRLRAADPTRAAAWLGAAAAEVALGRESAALATLDEASRLLPQDWRIAGAWCRVASAARDPRVRDGARAVQRARALVLAVRHPYLQATLAMALAETGDFAGAVEAQKQAIALTAPDSVAKFRATLERNLELYRRGEPSRDPGLS